MTKSIIKIRDKADNVFSKFIRNRDNHTCYTCGKQMKPSESQCGHYESRSHLGTRYSEENCHCQCVGCNVFKKGNYPIYALRLQEEYGKDILEKLHREAMTIKKNTDYEAIFNKYIINI
jgi:hypothetical protein